MPKLAIIKYLVGQCENILTFKYEFFHFEKAVHGKVQQLS